MDLRALIREVPDFPKPGVNFKDVTTVLTDGQALRYVIKRMVDHFGPHRPDRIVGVESRGFLLGAPLAYELGVGFVLVRKRANCRPRKLALSMSWSTAGIRWRCTWTPSNRGRESSSSTICWPPAALWPPPPSWWSG